MAVTDIDIWRSAKLLIDQFGENAELEAARRFDALTKTGDVEGRKVWRKIGDAIKDLDGNRPGKPMM